MPTAATTPDATARPAGYNGRMRTTLLPDRARRRALLIALALLPLAGCGAAEEVNTRTLSRARDTWRRARIDDYDLEWTTAGAQTGHYRVFVRDGQVRAIYMVRPGGNEVVAKPGAPKLYGVDGLFQILDEELEQAQAENPFGQPKGTRVVLRFEPDPRLGYPREFRRDVLGTRFRLALDVLRLDPNPAGPIPPPRT